MIVKLGKWMVFWCILDIAFTLFRVSLSDPFLLDTVNSKITTIDNDLENSFLVGFDDGQARRYSGDFSQYTSLTVP